MRIFLYFFLFAIQGVSGKEYGAQSMIAELKTVLVKRPDASFAVQDPEKWHYTSIPDIQSAGEEHDAFVRILQDEGVKVVYHDQFLPELADSIFVHDPVLITDAGSIILQMGKDLRRGESEALESKLLALGIPTYFKMTGRATAEAGDTLWVDENTLAVGQSYRTNPEGLKQLCEVLKPLGVEVLAVDLSHWEGEEACLHLQSLISLVDEKVAVVYKRYLAVNFIKFLEEKGFEFIEIPDEEFMTMASNILAIRPGVVLTIEGNPITKQKLEERGIVVHTYKGDEMSLKAEGGATCLTRPLLRGK